MKILAEHILRLAVTVYGFNFIPLDKCQSIVNNKVTRAATMLLWCT